MPRLIDDIRAGGVAMPWYVAGQLSDQWVTHCQRVLDLLRSDEPLPVLLIDNVSDYMYMGTDQENWDLLRDFPNLAPPFQMWWSEHRMPRMIHSKECGDSDLSSLIQHGRVGVLTTAIDPKDAVGCGIPTNTRWILWFELFVDFGRRECAADGPPGSIFMAIDEHGVLIDRPWMQAFDDGAATEIMRAYMTWLHPALLAVTFLHCKNVVIQDNPVPAKLAKRYRERHGVTPRPYKTLVIEPLKQILRTQGGLGRPGVGLAKAMHICRGHFRDYREGRGLFGKYNVLVWSPMTVRGTKGEKAPPREIRVKV